MAVLFGGTVRMDYGQIYVRSGDGDMPADPLTASFAGRSNGLCGAAVPGFLFLISGTHTVRVPFTVELHDAPPPVDETWEEVVGASYRPLDERAVLLEGEGYGWPLDRYLLQFWLAPPAPDRVLKQTSARAASWHAFARGEPPPPAPRRPDGWRRQLAIDHQWGGVAPPDRLLAIGFRALALARRDRPLVEAIERTEPEIQRHIARWAARRAYDAAGLSSVDWVAPALDAVDRGVELPPPFDDRNEVSRRLFPGGAVAGKREAAALPILWDAIDPDPLRGALHAVYGAAQAVGGRYRDLLAELRVALLVPPG